MTTVSKPDAGEKASVEKASGDPAERADAAAKSAEKTAPKSEPAKQAKQAVKEADKAAKDKPEGPIAQAEVADKAATAAREASKVDQFLGTAEVSAASGAPLVPDAIGAIDTALSSAGPRSAMLEAPAATQVLAEPAAPVVTVNQLGVSMIALAAGSIIDDETGKPPFLDGLFTQVSGFSTARQCTKRLIENQQGGMNVLLLPAGAQVTADQAEQVLERLRAHETVRAQSDDPKAAQEQAELPRETPPAPDEVRHDVTESGR